MKNARDAMALGLESLGLPPGAVHYAAHGLSDDIEQAADRAHASEVIARAAIEFVDAVPDMNEEATLSALIEAVDENRAAIT
ncbi:hypothetical protein [Cellulosimicrobium funkei]|uniref:hypothetical protein n=1 Tax=Cellulosimicrobium funkei TaxID=264251 RepID=UPI0036953076